MTRVDFYILPTADRDQRQLLACRLTEKAYRLGHSVFIVTESPNQNRIMNDLLWTFRAGSFIPHALAELSPDGASSPVVLDTQTSPNGTADVLINLNPKVPANYDRYQRLIELVDNDDTVRQAGRQRYRFYQRHALPLTTHTLDGVRPLRHRAAL